MPSSDFGFKDLDEDRKTVIARLLLQIGLSNLSTKQQNGRVYCTFNSTAKLVSIKEDGSSRTFDLGKEKYYLFLAWGPLYRGNFL